MVSVSFESITVAVLTFKRPKELIALLPELVRQCSGLDRRADVLVVDNDPEGSGAAAIEQAGLAGVRVVHEMEPGIAAARNRALDESDADLLVFIDDDERPVAEWLSLMVSTFATRTCAGVVGPVESEMAIEPEEWVAEGGFFERRALATGTEVEVAATNNLLLDMRVVRSLDLSFDARFGLSGGSDTLFTRALTSAGHRLVWCQEALVHDIVPAERLTRDWVLRRARRSGNSWSRTSVVLAESSTERAVVRVRLVAVGAIRVVVGAARWAVGTATRQGSQQARGQRTLERGRGMIGGAVGSVVVEYRRQAEPNTR